jgi:hypothetical protein
MLSGADNLMTWKLYIEIAADLVVAAVAYHFFGWIGFALCALFVMSQFAVQLIRAQRVMMNTLLSRVPDRCAFCHREIVDEGGILDNESSYHEKCIGKLESLESLRKEAGVPVSEAIHLPRQRKTRSAE